MQKQQKSKRNPRRRRRKHHRRPINIFCAYWGCDQRVTKRFASCDAHRCLVSGCRNERRYGGAYCGQYWCRIPTCDVQDCKEQSMNLANYFPRCCNHRKSTCVVCSVTTIGSDVCELHKCLNCQSRARYPDKKCVGCTEWKCQWRERWWLGGQACEEARLEASIYCHDHREHQSVANTLLTALLPSFTA